MPHPDRPLVAVRPPEYFPGLLQMALLERADYFVQADTFEYSRRSRQNRARLRTPQGAQWITVPVRGGQTHRPVRAVEVDNRHADGTQGGAHWRSRHRRALQYDYRSTPYFAHYEPRLVSFFEQTWQHLGPCACTSTDLLADLAGIQTERVRASTFHDTPSTLSAILDSVRRALGVEDVALLSPPEAASHDAALLGSSGAMRVLAFEAPRYRQAFDGFEPRLSFADLLFGYGPEARALLSEHTRVQAFSTIREERAGDADDSSGSSF